MHATLNFATRPFRDERPVFLVVGLMLAAAVILLIANARLYSQFHRSMSGTSRQIEALSARRAVASRSADEARTALSSFRVSSLAQESRGLLQIVAARRFSWSRLLARLEHVLPADVRVSRLIPAFREDGDVSLTLNLQGQSPDSVVHTISALSRDPAFSNVEIHTETSQERGVPEGRSFDIVVRYLPEPSK